MTGIVHAKSQSTGGKASAQQRSRSPHLGLSSRAHSGIGSNDMVHADAQKLAPIAVAVAVAGAVGAVGAVRAVGAVGAVAVAKELAPIVLRARHITVKPRQRCRVAA